MLRGGFHPQLFGSPEKNLYIQLLEDGEILQNKRASEVPDIAPTSLCLVFRADNHSKHDLFYIKRTLESLYPQGTIFIYKELVVMVSDSDRIVKLIEDNIDLFRHVREIGVSAQFGKLQDFPEQFQHAQEACRIGKQTGHTGKIHRYESYRFYHLLESVSDIRLMKSCIHPALLRLHEYDLSHDFSLTETLRVFIECSCSAKEAAGKLFLHRNTMIYRLGKIQELTGLDLSDAEVVFHLQYSYRINDLLHLI
jgi:sugar diacid utilization regulator